MLTVEALTNLKEAALRADVERVDVFQDVIRQAVDLLGLDAVWDKFEVGRGTIVRYARKKSAPVMFLRRLLMKDIVAMVDQRVADQDFRERTQEDKDLEEEIAKPKGNPFRGW